MPMSTNLVQDVPEWFISRNYSYSSELDSEQWLVAFLDRLSFDPIPESPEFFISDDNDVWEKHRVSYASKEDLFDAYLSKTQDSPGHFNDSGNFPAIKEVSIATEAKNAIKKNHVSLISVELDASEGTIIKQFTDWLTKRKREHPIPSFSKRGPIAPANRVLSEIHLNQWNKHRILPLWDIIFWKKLFKKDVSNDNIANWIYHSELASSNSDPKDKYRQSMDELKKAVELVFPLLYEVGNKGGK